MIYGMIVQENNDTENQTHDYWLNAHVIYQFEHPSKTIVALS